MANSLRDITREFARCEAPLETLRGAAQAERFDRHLADEILRLISEWEQGTWAGSAWSRNELRARAKELVPPAPEGSKKRVDPTAAMYGAGMRGFRR